MTLSNDRIRRVAEKHVELRGPCADCVVHWGWSTEQPLGNCDTCQNTRWTPLPVRDWADALRRAKNRRYTTITWFDDFVEASVWDSYSHGHAEADNADDALIMALEQADGVKK